MVRAALKKLTAWVSFRTPYARALENEVARLREENRALINSILGVAGIPPMRAAACATATIAARSRTGILGDGRLTAPGRPMERACGNKNGQQTEAAFVRRRSWLQIGRALEAEDAKAARRERQADIETFPTPRQVVPRV